MSLSVISYGGGVQSTALVVLATQGEIQAPHALFANVGDDSEHPDTLRYVREVMTPWAAERGIEVIELRRVGRDGTPRTLHAELMRPLSRSISIPVRMADTGAPGLRRCTADYKLKVVGRWCRAHGATANQPADVMVGISWDEIERLGNKRTEAWERPAYPLVDRRLTRDDCKGIIRAVGLPVPPKSSCFFCPFRKPSDFARMRRDEPALFDQAVALEATLNARRMTLGKDAVYLTRFAKPLNEAVAAEQDGLDFGGPGETCDEGYCWT